MKKIPAVFFAILMVLILRVTTVLADNSGYEILYWNFYSIYETVGLKEPSLLTHTGGAISGYYLSENKERIAFISPDGRKLFVRHENGEEGYTEILSNARFTSVSNKYIVSQLPNGNTVAKCGLYDSWTVVANSGYVYAREDKLFRAVNNDIYIKDDINSPWIKFYTDHSVRPEDVGGGWMLSTRIDIYDGYFYLVTRTGEVMMKKGIFDAWTKLDTGCYCAKRQGGVVYTYHTNGDVFAITDNGKRIQIFGEGYKKFDVEGDKICVLDNNDNLYYKEGIYCGWTKIAENATWFSLCDNKVATCFDSKLYIREGVFSEWTPIVSSDIFEFVVFKR